MTDVGAARKRGRPATLAPRERADRILDAFEEVVAQHGLTGASMDAVARSAGMSKRTLYEVFGGRGALFDAWVARIGGDLVRPVPPAEADAPLPTRLRAMLRREVEGAVSRRRLTVLRALIAEAPRQPELTRAFLRDAADAARARLAEELARAAAQGEIALADPAAAARLLLDMACLNPLDRLLDPEAPPPAPPEAEARLELALRVFMDGAR
jgi:AcrR family transcriptional regulator